MEAAFGPPGKRVFGLSEAPPKGTFHRAGTWKRKGFGMLVKLLVLFIALPLAEIVLLIEIGSRIGTLATLAILVLTAVLGASLAHREGLKVLWRIQEKMAQGIMPDEELIDGVLILAAGIVLLTPGLLTDAAGLLLLVPGSRLALKRWLRERFSQRIRVRQWE